MTQSVYDKAGQQVRAIDAKYKPPNDVFNARGQRTLEVVRLGFAIYWAYDAGERLAVIPGACRSQQVVTGLFDVEFVSELRVWRFRPDFRWLAELLRILERRFGPLAAL